MNIDKIPNNIKEKSDLLREEVFMIIDDITGGELSEYISDDIELMIFADYLGIQNEWFIRFVEKYEKGYLPTGQVTQFSLERQKAEYLKTNHMFITHQ